MYEHNKNQQGENRKTNHKKIKTNAEEKQKKTPDKEQAHGQAAIRRMRPLALWHADLGSVLSNIGKDKNNTRKLSS